MRLHRRQSPSGSIGGPSGRRSLSGGSNSPPSGKSMRVGVRRLSAPSGPWVDEYGRPARSPNEVYKPDLDQREVRAKMVSSSKVEQVRYPDDPDPNNWSVVRSVQVGKNCVVELKYPNCSNYEGRKVLLYKNVTIREIVAQKEIDPHFLETGLSPIARFAPTPDGWNMAIKVASL